MYREDRAMKTMIQNPEDGEWYDVEQEIAVETEDGTIHWPVNGSSAEHIATLVEENQRLRGQLSTQDVEIGRLRAWLLSLGKQP
jgi:hypothetical protein